MNERKHISGALWASIDDVEPVDFHSRMTDILEAQPLLPGVLTIKTARAISPMVSVEDAARRGAGVQLSYEGLRLTRSLVHAEPWTDEGCVDESAGLGRAERTTDGTATVEAGVDGTAVDGTVPEGSLEEGDAHASPDLDLLAAEVLVARGFSHLAETGVSDQAVEIVRRFGRNQTYEYRSEPVDLENSLEVDVIKLAINAGADLVLQTVPPALVAFGDTLAHDLDQEPLPDPDEALDGVEDHVSTLVATHESTETDENPSSTVDS